MRNYDVVFLAKTAKDMRYDSEYIKYIQREIKHMPEDVIEKLDAFIQNFQEKLFDIAHNEKALFDWSCKQTYIPMTNMMMAAAMIGIDSCPIEGFDTEKVNQLLVEKGIMDKEHFAVSCMVAFGYRKEDSRHPTTRRSMEKVVRYIS